MPRPRPCLIAAFLVVGLLAASCGGDDATSPDDPANFEPGVEAAPAVEQSSEQSPSPEPEPEQSLEPQTTPEAAQPESPTAPVRVVLGDRFEWCGGWIQESWDRYFDAFEAAAAASETLAGAVAAHAAATDELDKAEAVAALEDAQDAYNEARSFYERRADIGIGPLLRSADPEVAESDDTWVIALERAWEAFVSLASPEEVALAQSPPPPLGGLESRAYGERDSWSAEVWQSWEESWLPPRWRYNHSSEALNEMAATALAVAAELGAQAVSLTAEAAAARDALADALAAALDARDAAAVSDAASAAIFAQDLGRDLVFALGRAWAAVRFMNEAIYTVEQIVEIADENDIDGMDPGLLENAALLSADADAVWPTIEEIRDNLWRLEDPSALQVAYHAVLLHSAAHAAFARSLSESCQ